MERTIEKMERPSGLVSKGTPIMDNDRNFAEYMLLNYAGDLT
jgi:hypothetical protein